MLRSGYRYPPKRFRHQLQRSTAYRTTPTALQKKVVVALIAPPNHPAALRIPKRHPSLRFIVGNDIKTFLDHELSQVNAVLIIPPGDSSVLGKLWPHVQSNVTWVHGFYAGVDFIWEFISNHLHDRPDIHLTNGRGAFSSSLAEYVIASMLYFNKQIPRLQKNREEKRWEKFEMSVLSGKTVGFVGFGHIAKTTAKILKSSFGMKILALRRSPEKTADEDPSLCDAVYGFDQKAEVFRQSDFVVSTLPGTDETVNFVGQKEFAAMRPQAVFISCGRGVTVDENALASACKNKQILGAAVDVFKVEPLPTESPLWECENILITSHNADFTEDYFDLGWKIWEQNLHAFVEGTEMKTPVDRILGY